MFNISIRGYAQKFMRTHRWPLGLVTETLRTDEQTDRPNDDPTDYRKHCIADKTALDDQFLLPPLYHKS